MRKVLGFFAVLTLLAVLGSQLTVTGQPPATLTPDATAARRATFFAQFTPQPARYEVHPGYFRIIENADLRVIGLGAVAFGPDGLLYVGDGSGSVRVYGTEFEEVRRFNAPQPFALAFNHEGQLYVAQRNALNIDLYDRGGARLDSFWRSESGTFESFAVAPDGSLYVVWQTRFAPRTAYLARIDSRGNVLFNKALGAVEHTSDAVLSLTFDSTGEMTMVVTGFGKSPHGELAVLLYDPQGNPIRTRRPILADTPLRAPGSALRLDDGSLVLLSEDFFGWFEPNGTLRAGTATYFLREGSAPFADLYQRSAIALRPDRHSIVFADVRPDGQLFLRTVDLYDRLAPTLTPPP